MIVLAEHDPARRWVVNLVAGTAAAGSAYRALFDDGRDRRLLVPGDTALLAHEQWTRCVIGYDRHGGTGDPREVAADLLGGEGARILEFALASHGPELLVPVDPDAVPTEEPEDDAAPLLVCAVETAFFVAHAYGQALMGSHARLPTARTLAEAVVRDEQLRAQLRRELKMFPPSPRVSRPWLRSDELDDVDAVRTHLLSLRGRVVEQVRTALWSDARTTTGQRIVLAQRMRSRYGGSMPPPASSTFARLLRDLGMLRIELTTLGNYDAVVATNAGSRRFRLP